MIMNENSAMKKSDLIFQHYLVVFLDILGQRNILREIKDLPSNDKEKEIFLDKYVKPLERLMHFGMLFRIFLTLRIRTYRILTLFHQYIVKNSFRLKNLKPTIMVFPIP